MTYAPLALALQDVALPQSATPHKSFFARLIEALAVSRRRDTEREIARFLSDSGGKFTDETERQIERRFLSAPRW